MGISTQVCTREGHNIVSVRENDKIVPLGSGGLFAAALFSKLCSKCGLTLDEIRKADGKRIRNGSTAPKQSSPVVNNVNS